MGGEELRAGALLDEDLEVGEALVFQKISEFEARSAFEDDLHGAWDQVSEERGFNPGPKGSAV